MSAQETWADVCLRVVVSPTGVVKITFANLDVIRQPAREDATDTEKDGGGYAVRSRPAHTITMPIAAVLYLGDQINGLRADPRFRDLLATKSST